MKQLRTDGGFRSLAVGCVAFGPVTKQDIITDAVSEETAHHMVAGKEKEEEASTPTSPSEASQYPLQGLT